MGYPTGKIKCGYVLGKPGCGKEVIDWDCGTPGHACYKDWLGERDKYGNKVYVNHVCRK